MDLDLVGKVAIVTGGASGIGAATGSMFADGGATVVIADIQDEQGAARVEAIKRRGGTSCYVHANISNRTDV